MTVASQVKQTLASLKGSRATLQIYEAQTNDEESRNAYQVDSSGDLYLDLFDESVELPQPKAKELLYANLEKCQADFMRYALETEDEIAKAMYSKNAEKLGRLIKQLTPYLLYQ